jgi:hypothetical protein
MVAGGQRLWQLLCFDESVLAKGQRIGFVASVRIETYLNSSHHIGLSSSIIRLSYRAKNKLDTSAAPAIKPTLTTDAIPSEPEHSPFPPGTASVPEPMATILLPQLALCAMWRFAFPQSNTAVESSVSSVLSSGGWCIITYHMPSEGKALTRLVVSAAISHTMTIMGRLTAQNMQRRIYECLIVRDHQIASRHLPEDLLVDEIGVRDKDTLGIQFKRHSSCLLPNCTIHAAATARVHRSTDIGANLGAEPRGEDVVA